MVVAAENGVKEDFFHKLAEILEVEEVKPGDVLVDFAQWDSLSILSIIAMIDAQYGIGLTAADLKKIDTAEAFFALLDQHLRNKERREH